MVGTRLFFPASPIVTCKATSSLTKTGSSDAESFSYQPRSMSDIGQPLTTSYAGVEGHADSLDESSSTQTKQNSRTGCSRWRDNGRDPDHVGAFDVDTSG